MGIYEELGVRPVINAAGTVTRYGGSLMAPELFDIMREASQQFCLLDELHEKVGQRIAAMLDVEAAYVTASAACGLVLTTAACMAGTDPTKIKQLPDTTGMKHEVVIQKIHRIAYDQAIRMAGATLVVIDDQGMPPTEAMRNAINERTAAIFYMATSMRHPASIPFEEVVAIARQASVPVIVDAASECPPVSTLTRFYRAGADLVIFSGGKSLMGPQSTGLVIGRKDLIAACAANGNPFATVGRPMKVSREEIITFMKALERYLTRDHDADRARWEAQLRFIEDALVGIPHVTLGRVTKSDTYTVPLLSIRLDAETGLTRERIAEALREGEPRIVVGMHFTQDSVVINPHMLQPGQERIVAGRCREVLTWRG
ncbi:MAG: aminotransferase class V-fold PLP-dependent enzyme [Candidatus Latescibacteria bacterium]|nr:aminotransferase class V-fold PLP-dependent enzyme [Candidatus Latescibacterota bacterium]